MSDNHLVAYKLIQDNVLPRAHMLKNAFIALGEKDVSEEITEFCVYVESIMNKIIADTSEAMYLIEGQGDMTVN